VATVRFRRKFLLVISCQTFFTNRIIQLVYYIYIILKLFIGLSARDFILQFRHKVLLLFKLLLLEKRIVFYQSPVQPLCATILTLLSLYPGMIEHGLQQAACVRYYTETKVKKSSLEIDQ